MPIHNTFSLAGQLLTAGHEALEDLVRVVGGLHGKKVLHVLCAVALDRRLVVTRVRQHALPWRQRISNPYQLSAGPEGVYIRELTCTCGEDRGFPPAPAGT